MEALVRILLLDMGFKQFCAQQVLTLSAPSSSFAHVCTQESLASTYGAGISNACVVDMGVVKTSIACVDDGLVVADTR